MAIGGAAGWCAKISAKINGRWEATADREVYAKAGDRDMWLYVDQGGQWRVGRTASKDARRSGCWAHQAARAGGGPPEAGPAVAWRVCDWKGFENQRLRVKHAGR